MVITNTRTCGLLAGSTGGRLLCWEYRRPGAGDGTTVFALLPTPPLPAGQRWAAVATSIPYACGLTGAGGLRCWSWDASAYPAPTLPRPPPGDAWAALTGGDHKVCGLLSSGGLRCFGSNLAGAASGPALPKGRRWAAVAAGRGLDWGIDSAGALHGWGASGGGAPPAPRLPKGATWGAVSTAVTLYNGSSSRACGISSDGATLLCWASPGSAPDGVPPLPSGPTWAAVAAAANHTCALTTAATLVCVGTFVLLPDPGADGDARGYTYHWTGFPLEREPRWRLPT